MHWIWLGRDFNAFERQLTFQTLHWKWNGVKVKPFLTWLLHIWAKWYGPYHMALPHLGKKCALIYFMNLFSSNGRKYWLKIAKTILHSNDGADVKLSLTVYFKAITLTVNNRKLPAIIVWLYLKSNKFCIISTVL